MSGIAALSAGAAVAGAAATVYSTMKKGEGVAQNDQAKDAITAAQIARLRDYNRKANEIALWYNDQSGGQFNDTLSKTDPNFQAGVRAKSEAERAKAGVDAITAAPAPKNYSDFASDSTGAVKSENARQLVKALDLGTARAKTGAKINSYGDAALETGINLGRGAEGQGEINRVATLRNRLNSTSHQPVLSSEAEYGLASGVGSDAFNTGNLIQAGGNVLSAAGAYGLPQDAWNGLFQGPVPSAKATGAAAWGPQQPGLFYGLF
jgi:hypothetical protein